MVFITAGKGGGTGTGRRAAGCGRGGQEPGGVDQSAWSRGRSRSKVDAGPCRRKKGIQILKERVDTLIVIPNDRLLTVSNDKTSMVNASKWPTRFFSKGCGASPT